MDGPGKLGWKKAPRFVRRDSEIDDDGIFVTNYEAVREGNVNPALFKAGSLDEASVLRSYGSKTYQEFMPLFDPVKYRFVYTATPSPNRYKELIHYAGFLGIMDTGQALTRFFQRDSTQANNLTLYPHKEKEFWLWVSSWAVFIQKPSDLGYSDEGYELPPLNVRYHEVPAVYESAVVDRDGQAIMFKDSAMGLQDAAREKRDSLPARVTRAAELLQQDPEAHCILWHDLEAERHAIRAAVPGVAEVYGSLDLEVREQRVMDFGNGLEQYLSTKPSLSGSGCNFQRHCWWAIFTGIGYDFNDFIQAIHRIQRFQQPHAVRIDIIYSEAEREVLKVLQQKWTQHEEMVARMAEIIREFGLNPIKAQQALTRTIGIQRKEARGENYLVANNDCVEECTLIEDDSQDLIVTSIPFANHYEYTPSYNDFGHTESNDQFWRQMDFLSPQLLRILKPGRIAAIHTKDRIQFGNVTGAGVPTVSPFHCEAVMHYRRHGFDYMGMITVVTDVVRENNQTYRLGWSEQCKDGTKMGAGSPEYIILLHKPQSDRTRGYADEPVTKEKPRCIDDDGVEGPFDIRAKPLPGTGYSRSRWQVDAHAFWRSSGNRLLTADELAKMGPDKLAKVFTEQSLQQVYDYEQHVHIGEELDFRGALPSTFMSLAPGSHHPDVWHDVNRMLTLNGDQDRRGLEKHVCLARGSLVLTRERGYIPIEIVEVGEHALTHRGRWRRVLVARSTGTRPTITMHAQGVPGLTVTPDHKLWARLTDWVRERDGAERAEPSWVEAHATLGGYVNFKLPDAEPAINEDHQHWWIAGRWLADGHWEARGGASISCGSHEVQSLTEMLGNYAGAWRFTGTSHQVHILDRSGTIREMLADCGEGAGGKHLPAIAASLPIEQARALLLGYLSGDGHFVVGRNRWMATSVSRALALGIAMLAQRVFGAVASIHAGKPDREDKIDGRIVKCQQEWVVSFDVDTNGRKKPFVLDDGAWKKVRSLEDSGDAEVWCLRVEEDESFTAEGCIVKNCPLQFDIVDRLITRYSNKGELVFDPFGGLFTVPLRALKLGRKGRAVELNPSYFTDGVKYLKTAEIERAIPDLFGSLEEAA